MGMHDVNRLCNWILLQELEAQWNQIIRARYHIGKGSLVFLCIGRIGIGNDFVGRVDSSPVRGNNLPVKKSLRGGRKMTFYLKQSSI